MVTSNYRDKQAGSLATFIIIGIVLASLTAGGIYLAKQRGVIAGNGAGGNSELATTPNEKDDAQKDPENGDASGEENREDPATPQDEKTTDGTQQEAEPSEATQREEGDEDTAAPAPQPAAPTQPQQPQTPAQPAPQSTEAPRTGGQVAAQIPATGFEDQIMATTLGVTALMYGSVRYVQSRRRLNRL